MTTSPLSQVATALEAIGSALDDVPALLRPRVLDLARELHEEPPTPAAPPPRSPSSTSPPPAKQRDGRSRNMHSGGKAVKDAIRYLEKEGRTTPEKYARVRGLQLPVARERLECAADAGLICRVIGDDKKIIDYCSPTMFRELAQGAS